MAKIIDFLKTKKVLFFLFFLFILIRLPALDQIFLLHDERDIVLSGYSIAKTGKDLYGNRFPLVFDKISPNNPLIAIYYSAIWSLFLPPNVFNARLPFILISALLIFLVYDLIFFITKNKTLSLLTTIIFCFSPWIFHLARLALDIPLAIVLLLLGILFYFKKKRFLAYLLFSLTFFTYQGFRLLIPFLLIYLELFYFLKNKNKYSFLKISLVNLLFYFLLVFLAFNFEPQISTNRLQEIIFFNYEKNALEVDFRRMTSLAPAIVDRFFSNKLTVPIDYILENTVKAFDPSFLFKKGDDSAINGNAVGGQFFLTFVIFYFLGIISLGKRAELKDFYILGFIPVGIIPTLLSTHGASFAIRGILSTVGYSYLLTLGINFGLSIIQKNKYKKLIIALCFLLLASNILTFIYGYYFRRPVTVGELFNENERQLAGYLQTNEGNKITIYHNSPKDLLFSLVFLKNPSSGRLNSAQTSLSKGLTLDWEGFYFKTCDKTKNYFSLINAVVSEKCFEEKEYNNIVEKISLDKLKADQIYYKDYSDKTAYFIIE
ncbi:hypothetical protein A2774_04325 [Candidatus Roizmanbacteria bacterium RIFCSPHIGHO2_01_FULL_39_12c]|uniref:Glycosyltransferase RgtA/B/C/D-like domain-containing protein n=1 Tax=Candidatus Roizmanbacteria bacterium RIFCSPHIGHO2_01_FULL_39_12c TaxID=1802031 RepID=A0A1F7GA23_9BACT|nr:MAG: hypothetical protein A2774_04325 [Candidatus Roizmanbacteria bacterium RIFCSPHIGHO2_01_FULL_39_12c]OGK47804.1 MAG: hypothetical protein A2963_03045 [Candidatus Roizmanbacteria bacterium RIFCSPLOWO2_01_FULL_40_13]